MSRCEGSCSQGTGQGWAMDIHTALCSHRAALEHLRSTMGSATGTQTPEKQRQVMQGSARPKLNHWLRLPPKKGASMRQPWVTKSLTCTSLTPTEPLLKSTTTAAMACMAQVPMRSHPRGEQGAGLQARKGCSQAQEAQEQAANQ